jgi:hypothetical protein
MSFQPPTYLQASATAASAWERGLVAAGTAGLALGIVALNSETAYAFSGKVDWEGSVRKDIVKLIEDEDKRRGDGTGIGPTLIRLAWHASGTYDCKAKNGGSNGATMRFCPEGNWGANQGLCIARRLLEPIQAKYGCSFADLWTFAGKVVSFRSIILLFVFDCFVCNFTFSFALQYLPYTFAYLIKTGRGRSRRAHDSLEGRPLGRGRREQDRP